MFDDDDDIDWHSYYNCNYCDDTGEVCSECYQPEDFCICFHIPPMRDCPDCGSW